MRLSGVVACPECRSLLAEGTECPNWRYPRSCRPGDRGIVRDSEESPDTAGQDAGQIPGGESRRKVAQKGHRLAAPQLPVRVKRWGKSPPATVATRRLAKPRPVQGEAGSDDAARRGTGYAARALGQPGA